MAKQKSSSLSMLLEDVERLMLAGPIEPDVQRQCIQILSTMLQTIAHTTAQPLPGSDMQEIHGNPHVKRALEVAAAGGHSILLSGPHLSGKTQFARTLPTILPVTAVQYPFRSPAANAERVAFIGDPTTPGELTFAHTGVLFLKDLHEFDPFLLAAVRQSAETHMVTFPTGKEAIHFPAQFLLVATTMPCPCGFFNDPVHECTCSAEMILQHQQRIKLLIDSCFDIHVEVPRVREDLLSRYAEESSTQIRGRVEQARKRQHRRYGGTANGRINADLSSVEEIQRYCLFDPIAETLLRSALRQLHPSPRGILRMQKVARTIADLAGSEQIMAQHLAEAIQYRPRI